MNDDLIEKILRTMIYLITPNQSEYIIAMVIGIGIGFVNSFDINKLNK